MKKKMCLFIPFRKFLCSPLVFISYILAGCGHGNVKTSLSKRIIIITSDLYRCHHRVRQLENPVIKMNRHIKLRTFHAFAHSLYLKIVSSPQKAFSDFQGIPNGKTGFYLLRREPNQATDASILLTK